MAVSHKDKLKIVALMRREVSTSPPTSKVPAWKRVLNLSHEDLWGEPIEPEVIVEMDFVLGSRILQEVNEIAPDLTLEEIVVLGKYGVLDEE